MPNEHTIAENLQRLIDAKDAIAAAITTKGGTVGQDDGLEEFPTAINGISTGVDTSSDTVTAATLKSGYTAHDAVGQPITGTMLSQPTTVTAATLGDGETAYNASGELITGTMQGGLEMNVKFTEDYRAIPTNMFYNNHGNGSTNTYYSIEEVVIGDGIKSIGGSAFYNCSSLKSVTISDSVTSIGTYVFRGCSALKSITIPKSVTSIGGYTFQGCNILSTITINKPQGSISGSPWGAPNATVVWTG